MAVSNFDTNLRFRIQEKLIKMFRIIDETQDKAEHCKRFVGYINETFGFTIDDSIFKNKSYFNMFLRDEADSNNINAIGDYSGGVKLFKYIHNSNNPLYIKNITIVYRDKKDFRMDLYGNAIVLTNGIKFYKVDKNSNQIDFISSEAPIKTNGDWWAFTSTHLTGAVEKTVLDEYVSHKWELEISLENTEELVMSLNDNFAGLSIQHFQIQGSDYGTTALEFIDNLDYESWTFQQYSEFDSILRFLVI
jgi:hypothetical protein